MLTHHVSKKGIMVYAEFERLWTRRGKENIGRKKISLSKYSLKIERTGTQFI